MRFEDVCIDETMRFSTMRSVDKGTDGDVISLICPSGYHIEIKGKNRSFGKYPLQIKLVNKDNVELSEDTTVRIFIKMISESLMNVGKFLYKDVCFKEGKEGFEFENNILLEESDNLCFRVENSNINIDSYNTKFSIDVKLIRLEHNYKE